MSIDVQLQPVEVYSSSSVFVRLAARETGITPCSTALTNSGAPFFNTLPDGRHR